MERGRILIAVTIAVVGVFVAAGVFAAVLPNGNLNRDVRSRHSAEFAGSDANGVGVATPGPGPAGPRAQWVIDENARPGTAAWRISGSWRDGDIEGWASTVSAAQGDRVDLAVTTPGNYFRVEAYRMGFYGGLGGRLIWQSGTRAGRRQPKATHQDTTNMVEAPWTSSLTIPVDTSWPPGDYLLKLVSDLGPEHYVPLTVRDDNSRAAFVVQNSVTTWQAYNPWGGYDLYEGRNGNGSDFQHRSRVVSFDRPYAFGQGAADFLGNELPLVSLVESLGLDVTYWTDVDLHRRSQLLGNHRALISLGHDEYWSTPMRQGVEDARDRGLNIAFLGANAVFRHIRFSPSPRGNDRREIAYKSATEDPLRSKDPSEVSVDWRDPPVSRPESTLVGDYYECNPVKADMVVADGTAWVFHGTGLNTGDRLPMVVGPEYDRFEPNAPKPPGSGVQIMAHSPVRCRDRASWSDMTYYSAPSGAGVFATGTNWWVSRLSTPCPPDYCPHDDHVVQITQNILEAFGSGRAGASHPSFSNASLVAKTQGDQVIRSPRSSTNNSPYGSRPTLPPDRRNSTVTSSTLTGVRPSSPTTRHSPPLIPPPITLFPPPTVARCRIHCS